MITVTNEGGSTSEIIWIKMTPWTTSAIQTHVQIPGGDGDGITFRKGTDNATTTLTGRVPWTALGEQQYEALTGARLTINSGVSTRTGIAGTAVASQSEAPAWIYFTLSVTEE